MKDVLKELFARLITCVAMPGMLIALAFEKHWIDASFQSNFNRQLALHLWMIPLLICAVNFSVVKAMVWAVHDGFKPRA